MNKYEVKLKNILKTYFGTKFDDKLDVLSIIRKYLSDLGKDSKIAIWGAGEHTKIMFEKMPEVWEKALYIIDNLEKNQGKHILNKLTISPSKISIYDINTIIISTFDARKKIKRQISSMNMNIEVIDIYEYMENKYNLVLDAPFYKPLNIYLKIHSLKNSLTNSLKEDRNEIMQHIAYLYLSLADFKNGTFYLKKASVSEEFITEINQLMQEVKDNLNKRGGNDIFLMLIDALRNKDLPKMNFLNNLAKKSINFEKSFATSIYTFGSLLSIFSGSMPFENKLYLRKTLNENECELIEKALSNDFSIKMYSDGELPIINSNKVQTTIFSNYLSYSLWKGITDLICDKKENAIYFLYFLRESHPPHICGNNTGNIEIHKTLFTTSDEPNQTEEQYKKQLDDCLKYIDEQLNFYNDILESRVTQVIFSDHGQVVEGATKRVDEIGTLAGWHDDRCHNVFMINNLRKFDGIQVTELFSMKNFSKVISSIIDGNIKFYPSDFVGLQFEEMTNTISRKIYMDKKCEEYINGFDMYRTQEYKLVICNDTVCKLYKLINGCEEEIVDNDFKWNLINKEFSKIVEDNVILKSHSKRKQSY